MTPPSLQLTLCWKQISADEGGVYVLQQYDALLRRHAQQVVQTVIWKRSVAQTHQTDTVAQLACKSRAGKHTKTNSANREWDVRLKKYLT